MTLSALNPDWKWQLNHRITSLDQLKKQFNLSKEEEAHFPKNQTLPFAITPYYATLLHHCAIRKTVVPSTVETIKTKGERADPLGEEAHRVTPHLIHTYPDKILFLVTSFCSTYCRYCTRARITGKECTPSDYVASIEYIQTHPEIRDVLISGGDPLTLSDAQLDTLLRQLRTIPHIRTIRMGSKIPAVLPMRITPNLCSLLRRHRIWLSLHFIHPAELTPQSRTACQMLSDSGIGLVSQTVLLKGINDTTDTLTDLFYGLLESNVKPYYLLQCDPVFGSSHFRTSVKKGIHLIQSLHGRISGLAIPQYVIDAPGGGGKIPILSEKQITQKGDHLLLKNYEGKTYRYPLLPQKNSVH